MLQTEIHLTFAPRIAALSLSLFLVACGGDGSGNNDSVQPSTTGQEALISADLLASPAEIDQPWIFGEPSSVAVVDGLYSFVPTGLDPEDDPLTYSVENLPSWASFDASTGRVGGVPKNKDVGYYSGISITVSDGESVVPLAPFDIEVEKAPDVVRKKNPGHYISMVRSDDQDDIIDSLRPGVQGVQKRFYWKDFEPRPGQYDFSNLQSDLDLLAASGGMMIVFVEDKTFNGQVPTPDYLSAYTLENRNRGYTVIRWDPYVVERFKLLLTAMGEKFDSHPAFEGIAIQESAPGLTSAQLAENNYSPELYRDAIIDVLTTAATAVPGSNVFWYMNFMPQRMGYLMDIALAVAPAGVVVGGPDVLPDDWSLNRHAYPMYDELKGKVTLFNSVQFNSYNHLHDDNSYPTKYWTMDELFSFARDELHVSYLMWNRKTWRTPSDSYTWNDALPTIANNPTFNP